MNRSIAKVIDKEDGSSVKLYSYTPRGITKLVLLGEMNEETRLIRKESCPIKAQTLL